MNTLSSFSGWTFWSRITLLVLTLAFARQTLAQAPSITNPPLSKTVTVGQAVSFVVAAAGALPLTYEWTRNGQLIPGATTSTLSLTATAITDRGFYSVRVLNSLGARRSYFRLEVADGLSTVTGWGSNADGESTPPVGLTGIVAVAAGGDHGLALRADGTVVGWGDNGDRQATVPVGLSQVVAIAAGESHSVALKADGTVVTWGNIPFAVTTMPEDLSQVVAIAAGAYFTVAARADGSVVTWGWDRGQQVVPPSAVDVVEVAGGFGHILARKFDGTCLVWGSNFSGQLNMPAGLSDVAGISAFGDSNTVVRTNGSVVAWGGNSAKVPAGLANVRKVQAAGIALHQSGTVTAWEEWAVPPAGLPAISAISGGGGHVLAIVVPVPTTVIESPRSQSVAPGERVRLGVVVSGTGPFGYQWKKDGVALTNTASISGVTTTTLVIAQAQLTDAGDYTVTITNAAGPVTPLAARLIVAARPTLSYSSLGRLATPGSNVTIGVTPSGGEPLTYVWRKNGTVLLGATGSNLTLSNVGYPDAGWYHLRVTNAAGGEATYRTHVRVAPQSPGSVVVGWGYNSFGQTTAQLAVQDPVSVSAGGRFSVLLRADGTLLHWGQTGFPVVAEIPSEARDIVAVSSGSLALALRADGKVFSWAHRHDSPPSLPSDLRDLVDVAVGIGGEPLGLRSDGTVVGLSYPNPNPLPGVSGVIALAVGAGHSLALKSDGTVVAWGSNESGECNVPVSLIDVVAISAGPNFSMALKRNGTVVAWGRELTNQAAALANLSNVTAIGSGSYYAAALKSDGQITAWGSNFEGTVNDAQPLRGVAGISVGGSHSLAIASLPTVRIVTQPQSFAAANNADATFTVAAAGDGALNYQWRKNGMPITDTARISGATTATLTMRTVSAADEGAYAVQVSSSVASVVSRDANLTLKPVNDDFANAQVLSGKTGTVTGNNLTATRETGEPSHGDTNATVWFRWTATHTGRATITVTQSVLPSETLAVYTGTAYGALNQIAVANTAGSARASVTFPVTAGTSYFVVIGTTFGFGLGGGAFTFTYSLAEAPGVSVQPVSRTALIGGSASFSITATGDNLVYQWLYDDEPLAGATGTVLNLTNLTPAQAGTYSVRISNASGSITSAVATLSGPNPAPVITTQPQNRSVTAGQSASFSVAAQGSGRLAFQWRRNGVAIPGATSASLTLTSLSRGDADYYDVVVYDELSPRVSATARLDVAPTNYPGLFISRAAEMQPEQSAVASIYVVAARSDGKFYAGGSFETINGRPRMGLARFNADGTLDGSFVPAAIGGRVQALLPKSDGSVLVGGSFGDVDGFPRHTVVRLLESGTFDPTFYAQTPQSNVSNAVVGILPLAGSRTLVGGNLSGAYHLFVLAENGAIEVDDGSMLFQLFAMAPLPGGKVLLAGRPSSQQGFTRLNNDGGFDLTFSPAFTLGSGESIQALAVLPDGRILAGGALNGNNSAGVRRVLRLTADGARDATFTASSALGDNVSAIAVQSSGKVIVSASLLPVARLNLDGSLDGSFPPVTYQSPIGYGDGYVFSVQADDRILVGRHNEWLNSGPSSLFRLNADGTLDPSVQAVPRNRAGVTRIVQASSGKTVIAGDFSYFGGRPAYRIARMNADGTVDEGFNAVAGLDVVRQVLVQADGGLVVIGETGIVRLRPDGAVDGSFTAAGLIPLAVDRETPAVNFPGGRIAVAAVYAPGQGGSTGGLVVLKRSGARDTSFNLGAGFTGGAVRNLALQPDGRLLVGGSFTHLDGQPRASLVRLNANGTRDIAFVPVLDAGTYVASIALHPDGKMTVAGGFSADGNTVGYVARLNADGSRDTSFQPSPIAVPVRWILRQGDGKTIVHGTHQPTVSVDASVALVRLDVDGRVDPSFKMAEQKDRMAAFVISDDGGIVFANSPESFYRRRQSAGLLMSAPGFVPSVALPATRTAGVGTTTELVPTVAGTPRINYQWKFNGADIVGATGATLRLAGLTAANSGTYVVVASNAFGSAVSNGCLLTGPNPAPAISAAPSSATVANGQAVILTVSATGAGALTYQWRKDGSAIAGATTATLTIGSAGISTAGIYDVLVSDGLSTTISAGATITVAVTNPSNVVTIDPAFAPAFENPGGYIGGFLRLSGGKTLAFGRFSRLNGTPARNVVRLVASGATDGMFSVPLFDNVVYAAVEQSDGRVIVAGAFRSIGGVARNGIARLLTDGSLDPSFNPAGAWINTYALALLEDGRVVLGGAFAGGLARLGLDGATDPTFAPQPNNSVYTLAVQSGGRIVAGGAFTTINGVSRRHFARVLSDGSLDDSYGAGVGFNSFVYSIRSLSGDRLLVAGEFTAYQGATANRLVRLTANGAIDSGWNTGTGFNSDVYTIDVLADGRILAGGAFGGVNGTQRLAIARLHESGALDSSFTPLTFSHAVTAIAELGDGSVAVGGGFSSLLGQTRLNYAQLAANGANLVGIATAPGLFSAATVRRALPTSNGKIVVVGNFAAVNTTAKFGAARLNADGTTDTSFNANKTGPDGALNDVLERAGGKLVVAGKFGAYNGVTYRNVIQLLADGSPDPTWLAGGGIGGEVRRVVEFPDGRLLVVGGVFDLSSIDRRNGLAVLKVDGTLDFSFTSETGPGGGTIEGAAVQHDGRIVAGGTFVRYTANSGARGGPYLVRLLPNGDLDRSFAVRVDGTVTALVKQPDGGIMIAGDFRVVNDLPRAGLARLTAGGEFDPSVNPDFLLNSPPAVLAPQSDGSVYVGGAFTSVGPRAVARYLFRATRAGLYDSTFSAPHLAMPPTAVSAMDDGSLLLVGDLQMGNRWRAGVLKTISTAGPQIIAQPVAGTLLAGAPLNLSIAVAGGAGVSYQWLLNGGAIPGATLPSYSVPAVHAGDAGVYRVRITHSGGVLESEGAILVVGPSAPILAGGIGGFGGAIKSGSRWPLTAPPLAAGSPPFTYQWRRDDADISGATRSVYLPQTWQPGDSGEYEVRIGNSQGAVTTEAFSQLVTPTPDWDWRSPSPQGNNLTSVAFLNGRFLAGGARGTIVSSVDAQSWTVTRLSVSNTVLGFAFAGGTYVALSSFGGIWSSSDSLDWTQRASGIGADGDSLLAVTSGAGRFVAVGTRGSLTMSFDGVTWQASSSGISDSLTAVAYGGGRFLALGAAGRTYRSVDGIFWASGATLPRSVSMLTFGAGVFMASAGNSLFSSPDGVNWSQRTLNTAASIVSLQYSADGFLATLGSTEGAYWTSPDGVAWVEQSMGTTLVSPPTALAFGGGYYVMVGAASDSILTSSNGSSWSRIGPPEALNFVAAAANSTTLVALASAKDLRVGSNGTPSYLFDLRFHFPDARDVVFGEGLFVAVGGSGGGRIALNPGSDSSWEHLTLSGIADLFGVSRMEGRYFAFGASGTILSSGDGRNWVSHGSGTTATLLKGAFGNGVYVAVGAAGTILSSSTAASWQLRSANGIFSTINDVIFADGKFVLVSEGASIRTSTDGVTWTPRVNPLGTGLKSLVYAGGKFYAFSSGSTNYLTSLDGVTWTAAQHGNANATGDAVVFGDRIYLVGTNASIVSLPINSTAPAIGPGPATQIATVGSPVTFSVVATGTGPFRYQWFKDGTALIGATGPSLSISSVSSGDAGSYSVMVTNAAGSVLSSGANLTVNLIQPGFLASQARATAGATALRGAFTVEGSASKPMLIRAVGPTLANFSVTGFLADPTLTIASTATETEFATNNDWESAANAAQVASVAAQLGAYPLLGGSKDAAVLASFPPGTYRAIVGPVGDAGVASLEIYDASSAPRLVYVATRAQMGAAGTFAQGVALLAAPAGRTYLIRVLGPSTGLTSALADPELRVFSGETQLAANDNWGGSAALMALADNVGAMPIPPGSKDAALSFTPNASGAYTLQVAGVGGATGTALLEVFESDAQRAASMPVAVVSLPNNLSGTAGQTAKFGVVAVGKPAPTFQWSRNGSPISGAVGSTLVIPSAQVGDAGTYTVRVSNGGASAYTAAATLAITGANNATHGVLGRGYVAGSIVTLTTTLHFVGAPASLNWNLPLPDGWSFASDTSTANQKPAAGATGTLAWTWTTPPASPLTFTCMLNVPTGETATHPLAATFLVGGAAAPVVPSSLTVGPKPPFHSADTDGDYALSLFELTRVIELYNTRNGTVRTGAYRVDSTNLEDGFGADSTRVTAPASALIQYHSADTRGATTGSPRDGMIDLFELTRVIELYNTRAGTVRTGRYRVQSGTEDGFSAGP